MSTVARQLGPQQVIKKVSDVAFPTLIKKSSTGKFRFFVGNFCDSSSNGTNVRELLDMLHQKNFVNSVQTVCSCFFDVYNMENVTIGEELLG